MPDDLVLPFRVPDGKCFVLIGPSCYGPVPTFLGSVADVRDLQRQYRADGCHAGVTAWQRRTPTAPWQLMPAAA